MDELLVDGGAEPMPASLPANNTGSGFVICNDSQPRLTLQTVTLCQHLSVCHQAMMFKYALLRMREVDLTRLAFRALVPWCRCICPEMLLSC